MRRNANRIGEISRAHAIAGVSTKGNRMTAIGTTGYQENQSAQWVWTALIIMSGVLLSAYFACVTPFAALATLAALKLGRGKAFSMMGLVWLANQAIGYGLLGYPWTWDSAAWGLVIGVAIGVATVAARALATTRPAPFAVSLPFVAAFAVYEMSLYLAGFVLPVSEAAFSASVVRDLFVINSASICCLITACQLATKWARGTQIEAPRAVAVSSL